ncbi:CitMHS family transporter [Marinactinospora rubrisoli]|uniref:CitMHS family transporter n=1 Tax=Marinactinospora rubrisoli TaxID=2715399 RepID=A0ABW2KDQ9_9ACTN
MLVALGFLMIGTFMFLIMTKKLTPVAALIIVPTIFGLIAGAGLGLGDMVMEAITDLAPTAALLMFAIIYFGIMIDVGLFDPLIRFVLRVFGDDPAKVVVGTAVLAGAVSLDGDGSTTFIVTTSALLPVYLRMGLCPVVLTCVAGLANGVLNIVPWGGPTARAASALGLQPTDIFVPMLPSMFAGLAIVLVFAWLLGVGERRRLRAAGAALAVPATLAAAGGGAGTAAATGGAPASGGPDEGTGMADTALDPDRPTLRPRLIWFNLALTVAIMVLLVLEPMPIPTLFMIGCAIALVVNFRHVSDQLKELGAHGSSVVSVVAMVMAAGVLTGVLNGTGMVDAMSQWLVGVIPDSMGPYLAVITGLISLPGTFFMSNDAFYFGILPVLTETAASYGIAPVEMARAAIVGQPVHMQSPLVPAILLLVSLAKVDLGDHHKKVLWRAAIVSLVMLAVGVLTTVIPLG